MNTVFRKEIKYVIPVEQYQKLVPQLDACMKRDPNGKNGTYTVRSQYFDSLSDQDLHDNLSGLEEKRKIRIRIYSPEADWAKLEYKCKSGSDGVKYSMKLTREEAELMERHRYGFLLTREEPLAKQLYSKMLHGAYRPKAIVEYQRTAFLYPVSDVRITFDHRIKAGVTPYGLFKKDGATVSLMNEDVGVLEVKYNDFLPAHIKAIVQQIDHLAEASSKYSKSRLFYL